jgi:hypothetical protein
MRYNLAKIHLDQLRRIIQDAWDAVPDEYIQGLYDSWWRRCEAVSRPGQAVEVEMCVFV